MIPGRHPVLANLLIRDGDGAGGTGLGTETAKDTAGEIDPEPESITTTVFQLSGLHGDAVDRAGCRAEITGDTSFPPFGITGQYNPCPVARGWLALLFRVLNRHRPPQDMLPGRPEPDYNRFYVVNKVHLNP